MSEFRIESLDFCQSARSRSEEIEGGSLDVAVRASTSALTITDGRTRLGVGAAVGSAVAIGNARVFVFTRVDG